MESRIHGVFLKATHVALAVSLAPLLFGAGAAFAQDDEPPQVIEPRVERRDIDVGAIDTEDFELTGFVGLMSVEDFESGTVYGARLAYHISESFFTEASYGMTEVGTSSFEKLGGGAVLLADRDLTYYDLAVGYNLFPGEVFFGGKRAWNSSVYALAGLGTTDFADNNEFTVTFAFGLKVLPTDFISVRLEARDYMFDTEVTGEKKTTHNLQTTLNVGWFF